MRKLTCFHIAGACCIAAFVLACLAAPALAAWGVDPVTVKATSASIPLVEGCSDGAYGSFAAWQEGSTLRAQHLLPNGDLDPGWAADGAVATNVLAARTELVALPDRLGGLYLFWKQGATLYATRLDASGGVAAGWPAGGRALGDLYSYSPRPSVIEDGAHGFYAVWVDAGQVVVGAHLGPANTGAGGWQEQGAPISYYDSYALWAHAALAPDGGIYVAWASYEGSPGNWSPGYWKLKRLTTVGATSPGWPAQGQTFGAFHYEYIANWIKAASLLALDQDGRGGVFFLTASPTTSGYNAVMDTRLYRTQGNGQSAADWAAAGVAAGGPSQYSYTGYDPDESYRLLQDRKDGVFVGTFVLATDNAERVEFRQCSASAQFGGVLPGWGKIGYEMATREDGGYYIGMFGCCYYLFQSAYIQAAQFPVAPGVFEEHTEDFGDYYSDIGLARTDDGGAVFLWSQMQGRVGLFARRLNSAGEVTAVGPEPASTFGLNGLRFVRGEGVRATISFAGSARFELFDLAGRRIASQAVEARELTLAGTAALPSGLYFGRLVAGKDAITGKVIIAR